MDVDAGELDEELAYKLPQSADNSMEADAIARALTAPSAAPVESSKAPSSRSRAAKTKAIAKQQKAPPKTRRAAKKESEEPAQASAALDEDDGSPLLDLTIRATRNYRVGDVIPHLRGSLAALTDEQDDRLRQDRGGLQADFSVLVDSQGTFQLFLGPARFINVGVFYLTRSSD